MASGSANPLLSLRRHAIFRTCLEKKSLAIEPGATLQSWLDILGENFRGKLVSIYTFSTVISGPAPT